MKKQSTGILFITDVISEGISLKYFGATIIKILSLATPQSCPENPWTGDNNSKQ